MTPAFPRRVAVVAGGASAGHRLDELYRSFDHVTSATDPVHIVRRYQSPADRDDPNTERLDAIQAAFAASGPTLIEVREDAPFLP